MKEMALTSSIGMVSASRSIEAQTHARFEYEVLLSQVERGGNVG